MKHVLLLGAYSDIGQALARAYGSRGYGIWLAGRDEEKLKDLQADIRVRYEVPVKYFRFDAMDTASHPLFVSGLPGIPELTICVFGLLGDQDKGQSDWDHASRILSTNYTGAVSILNILANSYESIGKGTIVGISSVAGERGRQSNYLYGSAKGGFTLYLQGLRNRLASVGVHVLTVKPGFVDTRMTEHLKLPGPLTASPDVVAEKVYKAAKKKKNVLYVLWMWRWVMLIIKWIPEPIFKRMKL